MKVIYHFRLQGPSGECDKEFERRHREFGKSCDFRKLEHQPTGPLGKRDRQCDCGH